MLSQYEDQSTSNKPFTDVDSPDDNRSYWILHVLPSDKGSGDRGESRRERSPAKASYLHKCSDVI